MWNNTIFTSRSSSVPTILFVIHIILLILISNRIKICTSSCVTATALIRNAKKKTSCSHYYNYNYHDGDDIKSVYLNDDDDHDDALLLLSSSSSSIPIQSKSRRSNPILIGIQRAFYQCSSIPITIVSKRKSCSDKDRSNFENERSTILVSSSSLRRQKEEHNYNEEEDNFTSLLDILHPTRLFSSIQQHQGSTTEITKTIQPFLKTIKQKRQKDRVWGKSRNIRQHHQRHDQQQKAFNTAIAFDDLTEEDILLFHNDYDIDDDCSEIDNEHFNIQYSIQCSSVTQPVALLQGKFWKIHNPTRRLTSKSTATNSVELETSSTPTNVAKGGSTGAAAAAPQYHRPLMFAENMVCGAVSRSVAQTIMHPANTMKTMLQSSRDTTFKELFHFSQLHRLSFGAFSNFLLSIPHGAVNFAVLEFVRGKLSSTVDNVTILRERKDVIGPGLDFMSSAISTICCSVVSTPQMMITDNIMAGNYPNLISAVSGLYGNRGIAGFYSGWWPGLVGKIPSYALTWTFFQQLKRMRNMISDRPAKNYENTIMGCVASAATVCIMIPMDTIKTRLVTQSSAKVLMGTPYKGIIDCAVRIAKEEGVKTFYRGLAPRLISVVPMIGIQFGVYEAMKRVMLQRDILQLSDGEDKSTEMIDRHEPSAKRKKKKKKKKSASDLLTMPDLYGAEEAMEEAAMEVAADGSNTFPAPHFLKKAPKTPKKGLKSYFGYR